MNWTLDSESGIVDGVIFRRSPNFDVRPDGVEVELIVIHNISLPKGVFGTDDVEALFMNRLDVHRHADFGSLANLTVSAHFFIRRDGHVIQFVACRDRAWHAGLSSWKNRSRCNDFSIGIELEGTDETPYHDKQYDSLIRLTALLEARYPIVDRVGHCDIAPGRKTDPGPSFDWSRYEEGVAAFSNGTDQIVPLRRS